MSPATKNLTLTKLLVLARALSARPGAVQFTWLSQNRELRVKTMTSDREIIPTQSWCLGEAIDTMHLTSNL